MPNHRFFPRSVTLLLGLAISFVVLGCEGRIGDLLTFDANPQPSMDAPNPPLVDARLPQMDAPPQPDAPPVLTTCDEIYGVADEYLLCEQGPDTCEFNALTDGGNCNQLCAAFGGQCVAAYDNVSDPGLECERRVDAGDDCTTNRNTEICVCTRY